MPNYEYECTKCGYVFEKLMSVAKRLEPRKWVCPNCREVECLDIKIGASNLSYSTFGRAQPPREVMERLRTIGKETKDLTGHEMHRKFGH